MKNKVKVFMLLILISLFGLMVYISIYADIKRVPDILLITPKQPISTPIDYQKIEDKNGEDFLLTYETSNAANIKVMNKNHDVILKGTNYLYPYVMSNRILSGSFFSKDAQKENKKLAVLNKKSAFELFGNMDISDAELKIDEEIFTVIGVINDRNKDNMNVYIPVTNSGKPIDSFAALVDGKEKTPETALENKLKPFKINSTLYNFYNFNKFINNMNLRLLLSLKLFLLVALAFFVTQCFKTSVNKLSSIKKQSEQLDLCDLLINNKTTVASMLFFMITSVGFVIAVLATAISSVKNILSLKDIKSIMLTDYSTGFTNIIYTFNKLSVYSLGVFIACVTLIVLFTFLLLITGIKTKDK